MWEKKGLMEAHDRVPMIIRAPATTPSTLRGKRAGGIVELVDMYPTLAELTGLPVPPGSIGNGVSVAGMVANPENNQGPHKYALSIYPRCGNIATGDDNCNNVPDDKLSYMGYAVRDYAYRYVSWRVWNGTTQSVDWTAPPYAQELYDHRQDEPTGVDFDSWDLVNVAGKSSSKALVEEYESILK